MEKLKKAKRITRATFKSFVKRNKQNLYVNERYSFDGMIDGFSDRAKEWKKVKVDDEKLNKGVHDVLDGVWLVGDGRDYFNIYEDDKYYGLELYNSCGRSFIAVEK